MSKLEDYLNSEEARARAQSASAAAYAHFGAYLKDEFANGTLDPSAMPVQLAWFAAAGPVLKNNLLVDVPTRSRPLLVIPDALVGIEAARAVAPLDLAGPRLAESIDALDPVASRVLRVLDAFGEPVYDDGFDDPREKGGPVYGGFPSAFRERAAGFASPLIRRQCEDEVRNANASGMGGPNADFPYFDSILTGLFVSAAAAAAGPLAPVVTGLGLLLVPRLIGAISRAIDSYKHNDVPQW